MEQLNKKRIISINLFLSVLVLASVIILFIIHSSISKNIELTSQSLEKFNQSILLKKSSDEDLMANIENLQIVDKQLDNLIIDGYNIVDFLNFLDSLAVKSGVSISISNIETTKDYGFNQNSEDNKKKGTAAKKNEASGSVNSAEKIGLIAMEAKISGSEIGVIKFLKLFENSPYIIETKSLDLKMSGNSLELNLKFEAIGN